MSTASCIHHPEKDDLLILRTWQTSYCQGNRVAAGLLSILEYWHNVKYEKQCQKPAAKRHANDLLQFHNEKELISKLMHLTKTPAVLRRAIKFLAEKKVITLSKNPSKRYSFDRTRHFLFHPDVINKWLKTYRGDKNKLGKQVVELEETEKIEEEKPENQSEKTEKIDISLLATFLKKSEQDKTRNILLRLDTNISQETIINEWKYALKKRHVKNKFAYLSGLVNRANKGKLHPSSLPELLESPSIDPTLKTVKIPPTPQAPHEIYPLYVKWKQYQTQLLNTINRADYYNFVLPIRAYAKEKDKCIFLRCPNVYAHQFITENKAKIEQVIGMRVCSYMG